MRNRPVLPRLLPAAAFAAIALPVSAANPISGLRPGGGGARVTIRGTGKAISIERRGEARLLASAAPSPTVLDQAIAMKEAGTTDEALVWYLQAHRSELPSFVDFETASALRRAGAGRTVIAYLTGVAAVEVGPTGAEGGSREDAAADAAPAAAAGPEMTNELPASLAWGGVVIGAPARGFHRRGFGRERAFRGRIPSNVPTRRPHPGGTGRFPRR